MSQLSWGPATWPKVYGSSCKRMSPTCVISGLHLVKWTRYDEELSYLEGTHTVHWSSYRFQLISQLGPLTILFPREKCSLFPVLKSTLMLVFFSLDVLPEWLNISSCKTKFEERKNENISEENSWTHQTCEQFRGEFLNCTNIVSHWPNITSSDLAEEHYK